MSVNHKILLLMRSYLLRNFEIGNNIAIRCLLQTDQPRWRDKDRDAERDMERRKKRETDKRASNKESETRRTRKIQFHLVQFNKSLLSLGEIHLWRQK